MHPRSPWFHRRSLSNRPSPRSPPTGAALPGETLRADLASWQGITVVLALAVILAIAFDTRRPRRGVLIDLLLMFGAGACLFDVIRFFDHLNNRAYVDLLDWVFIGVFALTFTLMVRSLCAGVEGRADRLAAEPWPSSARRARRRAAAARRRRRHDAAAGRRRVLRQPRRATAARAGPASLRRSAPDGDAWRGLRPARVRRPHSLPGAARAQGDEPVVA